MGTSALLHALAVCRMRARIQLELDQEVCISIIFFSMYSGMRSKTILTMELRTTRAKTNLKNA